MAIDVLAKIDEHELVADICRESFWDFIKEFWSVIIDEPMIDNWHMEYLCRELQDVAKWVFERKPKRYDLLINISPGTTKSTIATIMFPVWCWIEAPWIQTICGSYGNELALDLSSKSRDVVQSGKFRKCFPELSLRPDQNTKTFFQNTKGGWRYATSTGGAVTGKHGHINIIDDPIDPRGAVSIAELKAANEWLTNVISKRKVNQERTVTIMIMQRLSMGDPSALWLELKKKGVAIRHICLPAEMTEHTEVKPKKLGKYYKDGLMDPVRLGRKVLNEQKLMGLRSYAGQYLQRPSPPGGDIFKVGFLEILNIDYRGVGWKLVRFWDKAATRDAGCFTVGLLMGYNLKTKEFWVLDVARGQWDSSERERIMKQTAQLDGKKVFIRVEAEGGSGGKESAEATIRNLAGFRVKAEHPTGKKWDRADPYAAQVNAGNVKLRKGDWNAEYIKELSYFYDEGYFMDQVDASSGAFNFLAKRRLKIGSL